MQVEAIRYRQRPPSSTRSNEQLYRGHQNQLWQKVYLTLYRHRPMTLRCRSAAPVTAALAALALADPKAARL